MYVNGHTRHSPLPCLHPFRSAARSRQSMRCTNSFHAGSPRKPTLLLVSALDPSNHSRPRRTVSADCALPTYPVFVHAALIHTATFTRLLWDCPISLLRRKTHIRAYTPVTPRVASLSAHRNDKRANIRTQMPLFASLCAHGHRFGAHLGTQRADSCSYTGDSTLDELHIIEWHPHRHSLIIDSALAICRSQATT